MTDQLTGSDNPSLEGAAALDQASIVEERSEKLSLETHISYGASQFGLNCIMTAFGINMLFFYSTVLKFSPLLFTTVVFIGQVWDAISDPLMGHISDNTKWKSGRRRPYFLLGSIPLGIAFFLIFSPPAMQSTTLIFLYLLILILVMFTARTVFETPYLALAPELTLDYNERTKLSGFKQLLGTLGDAQGAILPFYLLGLFYEQRKEAHFIYGLIACFTMILVSLITWWGTFEKPGIKRKRQAGIKESFKAVAKNQPYLIFIFSSTVAQMSNYIVTILVLFITKYWFLDEALAKRFFIVFFAGCVCSVPGWVYLTNRIGKKLTYIIDMTGYGILLLGILLLKQTDHNAATVVMFIAGVFNVGLWILAGTIAPDIIEWDEYQTGERREGVYAGVWTFVYKAGIGLAFIFVGFGLTFIRFDSELPVQTASTLTGLRVLFGPIPAIFLLIGALVFFAYPITKHKHEEIRRLIRERNRQDQE